MENGEESRGKGRQRMVKRAMDERNGRRGMEEVIMKEGGGRREEGGGRREEGRDKKEKWNGEWREV